MSRSGAVVPSFFGQLSALGSGTQALLPGIYAWALTIAPVGFAHGGSIIGKVAASAGFVALFGAAEATRRGKRIGQIVSVWGLALSAMATWASGISDFGVIRAEPLRMFAGLFGWTLFGFASAAPAVNRTVQDRATPLTSRDPELARARRRLDGWILGGAALLAATLQCVGWDAPTLERAVLVRLTTVCASIAVIGAAADIVVVRHVKAREEKRSLTQAVLPLVFMALFVIAAVLLGWAHPDR